MISRAHRRRPDRSCFRLANGGPTYLFDSHLGDQLEADQRPPPQTAAVQPSRSTVVNTSCNRFVSGWLAAG
eukprot:COSAG01_NODE_6377_length_3682_cov_1.832779_2_plen_71_part_00